MTETYGHICGEDGWHRQGAKDSCPVCNPEDTKYPHSMTRAQWRHELAARAMASFGMVAPPEQIAKWAYERADAMIKEAEK